MPNDAKFGLIVGVALVIAVAVLFYQGQAPVSVQPAAAETSAPSAPTAAAVNQAPTPGVIPVRPDLKTPGQTTSRIQE